MIDKAIVEQIKSAIDIVDVIGDFVELKKRGASYVGLCPFHNDHSPSFYVSPSRGTWHCFVCDEGGDAVSFLMKKLNISYPEALKHLASRYSISIPEKYRPKDEWKKLKDIEAMLAVNDATMQYYESCLTDSEDTTGMDYFHQRGFTDDTLHKFHVGYAPVRSNVIGAIKDKGLEMKYLMPSNSVMTFKSGKTLHVTNGTGTIFQTNGRFADKFIGRVIFPWFNVKGDVIAFGARKLDAATKGVMMKYCNSSDSLVYHKNKELWGLYQAKSAITKTNEVIMVEGYTDVMMFHQIGIENVVSNSGTALSIEQARLLFRFTNNILLVYDSDKAGIDAAVRAIPILLQQGLNVRIALLPEGEDPDSFTHSHSADEVHNYLQTHKQDFVAFMSDRLLKDNADTNSRAEGINVILANIALVNDAILRELYVKELANLSGISEDVIKKEMAGN